MLDPRLTSQAFLALMLLFGIASIGALMLLCAAWRPMKATSRLIPSAERSMERLAYEPETQFTTQRKRYVLVLSALSLASCVAAILSMNLDLALGFVDDMYQQNKYLGVITDTCGFLPYLTVALSLLMLLRVHCKPSPFVLVIMFGPHKGDTKITNLNRLMDVSAARDPFVKGFGSHRYHEGKMRNRQYGELHHDD